MFITLKVKIIIIINLYCTVLPETKKVRVHIKVHIVTGGLRRAHGKKFPLGKRMRVAHPQFVFRGTLPGFGENTNIF